MARLHAIETVGTQHDAADELVQMFEFGLELVSSESFDEGREGLVEPQVTPPLHGYQVAEPLVGQLVDHHRGYPVLLMHACILADQQVDLALSD